MYKQITSEQRYTISILLQQGMKKKDIATAIKVSPSTISRELKRNSGSRGGYNWETAQKNAFYHKHRCPDNRSVGQDVKEKAIRLLKEEQWSPEQISGSLAKEGLSISHETIYARTSGRAVTSTRTAVTSSSTGQDLSAEGFPQYPIG